MHMRCQYSFSSGRVVGISDFYHSWSRPGVVETEADRTVVYHYRPQSRVIRAVLRKGI